MADNQKIVDEVPSTSKKTESDKEKERKAAVLRKLTDQFFITWKENKSKDASEPSGVNGDDDENEYQELNSVILTYEGVDGKISLTNTDIARLGFGRELNDQVIYFWLSVIQTEKLSQEDKSRTFFFDTFFFPKLAENKLRLGDGNVEITKEIRHSRVQNRTKKVDIFEKDFVIVPINKKKHWFFAVICFPGLEGFQKFDSSEPEAKRVKLSSSEEAQPERVKHPCILVFDSAPKNANYGTIYSLIRDYLCVEWKRKNKSDRVFDRSTMPGCRPSVPLQINEYDCGLFMLHFLEYFFTHPIPTFEPSKVNLRSWHTSSTIGKNKRTDIYSFILKKTLEKGVAVKRLPVLSFAPKTGFIVDTAPPGNTQRTVEVDGDDVVKDVNGYNELLKDGVVIGLKDKGKIEVVEIDSNDNGTTKKDGSSNKEVKKTQDKD